MNAQPALLRCDAASLYLLQNLDEEMQKEDGGPWQNLAKF